MKYGKSFKLLWDAAKNCKHEMWQAVQVLLLITLGLVIIFYITESYAQPQEYGNPIWAIVWALTQYIGDPGGFAGPGPITTVGRLVATAIGIINILIFAVPAGMIGSGFSKAIKDENHAKKLRGDFKKIISCFNREQCRHTKYRCVRPYLSLTSLQVKLGMTADDIIAAVEYSKKDKLRLRNIADTYSPDKEAQDKLVVEMFPLAGKAQDGAMMTKTSYGCLIDRKSKVTIVATSSQDLAETSDSHFAYYLSLYGGFNYISREFGGDNSFYTVSTDTEKEDKVFKDFKSDLVKLSSVGGSSAWTIFLMQVPRDLNSQFCFVHNILPKHQVELGIKTSVMEENEQLFISTFNQVKTMLENGGDDGTNGYKLNPSEKDIDTPLTADLDESFGGVGKRNIGTLIGAGKTSNAFTIRVASKLIARDRRDIPIAAKMADIFRMSFEPGKVFDVEAQEKMRKLKGIGYAEK